MASGTDYAQSYQAAEKAYMQGSYEEAAKTIDVLADEYPTDPSVLLLKGHIYCYGLHQYDVAQQQYKSVLQLSSDPEFVDYANNGLEYAVQADSSDDGQINDRTMDEAISPMPDEFDDGLSEAADSFDAVDGFDAADDFDAIDSLDTAHRIQSSARPGSTDVEADDDLDIFSEFASESSISAGVSSTDAKVESSDSPFEFSSDLDDVESDAAEDDGNPFNIGSLVTEDMDDDDPLSAALSDDPFSLTVSGDAEESATTFSNDAADFDMAEFDEAFGTSSDTVRDADAYDDEDEAEEDFNGLSFDPIADEGTEDKHSLCGIQMLWFRRLLRHLQPKTTT
ncbi:MAG: tetratricopeptide repeat protein, partial [Phormidesmis sp. RL_2_1]|nr:tetratricopeptide repeat protein [Phormidesmis sp. RL_2_1]